jgi:hypothetical protein
MTVARLKRPTAVRVSWVVRMAKDANAIT